MKRHHPVFAPGPALIIRQTSAVRANFGSRNPLTSCLLRAQRPVEVESGADLTQVGERLGKFPSAAPPARLLRVQSKAVGISEHLLEGQSSHLCQSLLEWRSQQTGL